MFCIFQRDSDVNNRLSSLSFIAPFNLNVKSAAKKRYNISWSLSPPIGQTVKNYHASLAVATVGSKKEPVDVSTDAVSLTVDVDYDKKYTFEIGIETEAGKSDLATISWLSHSGIYDTQYQKYSAIGGSQKPSS